jgi:hypothetical protein
MTYGFKAKIHSELKGSYKVVSSAGGLDTLGRVADEGLVGAQAFGVGDNAATMVNTGCAWKSTSCTMLEGDRKVYRGCVELTWEGVLASD